MPANSTPVQDAKYWANLLDGLATQGEMGPFSFLKKGRTRIRICPLPGSNPPQFFTECFRTFKGQTRRRFLVLGTLLDAEAEKVHDVKAIVVPKTVLQAILELLAGGDFDLLSPEEGHGISVTKSGSGLETGYSVVPSPKPVVVNVKQLSYPKESLPELSKKLSEMDRNRGKGKGNQAAGEDDGDEGDGEDGPSGNW